MKTVVPMRAAKKLIRVKATGEAKFGLCLKTQSSPPDDRPPEVLILSTF